MKALLLILSALSISTDTTIYNQLPAHWQRQEQVVVNEGRASIEVYTVGDKEDLSCAFGDAYVNAQALIQTHTHHCYVMTNKLSLPATIAVLISNNEGHPIHYIVRAKSVL